MEIRLTHILIIIAEMPCLRASAYINCTIPLRKEVISMSYDKCCYGGGYGTSVGIVLVLFILLVIVLSTFWI
jgi:hypothetical protein